MTMPKPTKTFEDELQDLLRQATEERSHYYVAAVLKKVITDRKRLMDALELAKRHISQRFDYVSLIALKEIDAILNPKQESGE